MSMRLLTIEARAPVMASSRTLRPPHCDPAQHASGALTSPVTGRNKVKSIDMT